MWTIVARLSDSNLLQDLLVKGSTAGCNTGANVYATDFFSETSYETELNHKWQV
jgi:hypothetical protein